MVPNLKHQRGLSRRCPFSGPTPLPSSLCLPKIFFPLRPTPTPYEEKKHGADDTKAELRMKFSCAAPHDGSRYWLLLLLLSPIIVSGFSRLHLVGNRAASLTRFRSTARMAGHVPLNHTVLADHDMLLAAKSFRNLCELRRTCRFFDSAEPPLRVVTDCIAAAGTAPSGAHKQPWTFVVVKDQKVKEVARKVVETAERVNYENRMSKSWKADLEPMVGALHTAPDGKQKVSKPYISEAPYLVFVFMQKFGLHADENGKEVKEEHYYVSQSVGIAVGLFTAALHASSLCSLISTPMGAEMQLHALLKRPKNEKLYCLLPVGFPAHGATVPFRDPVRKSPDDITVII